ncbi:MAG TPA: hypothetical protein VHA33_19150 [Candidatus Angelobacter sp.]|jgi:hypothetical protein|nr:hypothetical protein [Candidatus Angelobacter sp.]
MMPEPISNSISRHSEIIPLVYEEWREEAARHDISKTEIERMASAFEHHDLKTALSR